MDLWWRLSGYRKVRLTGADVLRSLRSIAGEVSLERLEFESELSVTFLTARKDRKTLEKLAQKLGDRLEILRESGLPQQLSVLGKMPIVTAFLCLLTGLTLWLPSRVLFIEVEGCSRVPQALVTEKLEDCGLFFGVSRREIRSEQIKNRLLYLLPELGWAGVNTRGCTATVTVREREEEALPPARLPGDIVAGRSGVITSVTASAGTSVCRPGQAVQKGQMLISGMTDVGLATVRRAAQGEVFADTVWEISAAAPEKIAVKTENGKPIRRYSLIFGKKRIKFYQDSGILYPGCGKMKEAIPWELPGGWRMPVTLVIETCFPGTYEFRPRRAAQQLLRQCAYRQIGSRSIAAVIRRDQTICALSDGLWRLEGEIGCREMIGRTTEGVYLEDDAKDVRTSGECGAG